MSKLRVGILGLRRGRIHVKNYAYLDDVEVIGCADRYEHLRENMREVVPEATMVEEYDELLAMEPDAVVVSTNGRCQAEHAIRALKAGCHVISEVPGAFTVEEAHGIVAAAQVSSKQYMLAENSSFWDFVRYFRKWVMEGRIGEVCYCEGEYIHYLPNTLVTPENDRITPRKAREEGLTDLPPSWRADQPPIQYLTHELGPLLEVLDDRVVSVVCQEGPWWQQQAPLRADAQTALFKTAAGRMIKITVSLNTQRPDPHNYRLMGTEGTAEWYRHERFARLNDETMGVHDGWKVYDIGLAAPSDDTSTGHAGADLKTAHYFTRALLEDQPVPIDVYRMCDYTLPGILAARSAELGGQPITVPDVRSAPRGSTEFWNHVELPVDEPEPWEYTPPSRPDA
jgi:predicted dehydrogenase